MGLCCNKGRKEEGAEKAQLVAAPAASYEHKTLKSKPVAQEISHAKAIKNYEAKAKKDLTLKAGGY